MAMKVRCYEGGSGSGGMPEEEEEDQYRQLPEIAAERCEWLWHVLSPCLRSRGRRGTQSLGLRRARITSIIPATFSSTSLSRNVLGCQVYELQKLLLLLPSKLVSAALAITLMMLHSRCPEKKGIPRMPLIVTRFSLHFSNSRS